MQRRDDVGQQIGGHHAARRDAHRAGQAVAGAARLALQRQRRLAHAAGILDEVEGGGRRLQAARLAAEQRRVERFLKLADMPPDGRLDEAEPIGRRRQRSAVDHGEEGTKQGPVEHFDMQK